MKVVWVVNHIMPELADKIGVNRSLSGGWLVGMAKDISSSNDLNLHIICPGVIFSRYKIGGVEYVTFPLNYIDKFYGLRDLNKRLVMSYLNEIKPDIIHVQGTEFCFSSFFNIYNPAPTVFSIQGFISEIVYKKYNLIGLKKLNLVTFFMYWIKNLRDSYRAKSEISQLKNGLFFIGRTLWDEAYTYYNNPARVYYYCGETIRPDFYMHQWDLKNINRHTLFCAGGYGSPLKGFHNILYIASLLKRDFPDLKLVIPGDNIMDASFFDGYKLDLKRLILKLDLKSNVNFIGALDANKMAMQFSISHAYLMGSSIENSSNTLCEAMCVGTPAVLPFVGGVPSLAQQNIEALFYQSGDNASAAIMIKKIFDSDSMAISLSEHSRIRAFNYSKNMPVAKRIIDIYRDIIARYL